MHAARPAIRLASFAALLLILAAACASAQGFAPTPPSARTAKVPSPAQNFVGLWHSLSDTSNTISINGHGNSAVIVLTQDHYEATGFATGNEAVLITRKPHWNGDANATFETGVLRLERLDQSTLRARYCATLSGPATAEETWTSADRRPQRPASPNIVVAPPAATPNIIVAPPDGDSPKFGEYVYVEELPEAIVKASPVYPDGAREHRIEGQVLVQALVGKDGLVKDTRIVKSIPELDDAAVAAVRQWRFKPALAGGQPIAVWVAVPMKFALH